MSENTLKDQLKQNTIAAMRAGEKEDLRVLRMLGAAIKQKEVDERIELNNADVLAILNKMVKERRDAAEKFEAGNRPDLVEKETFEITVLQRYLPKQLTEAEIDATLAAALSETNATSMADMGRLMATVKPQLEGRADMKAVSLKVKALLTAG